MNGIEHELARQYGTPLYVYRLPEVRRAAADLRAALPDPSRLYYSVKANPHPSLATALSAFGLEFEVSSVGELATIGGATQQNRPTLYTGPAKSDAEIDAALRAGVRHFSVESVVDRDRICAAARRSGSEVDYVIRLNGSGPAATGLRMTGKASQFGVDLADVPALGTLFQPSREAAPIGVHMFSATNIDGADQLLNELTASATTASQVLKGFDCSRRLVDLGGGFSAPFARPGIRTSYQGIRDPLSRALDDLLPGWRSGEPVVAFESGRYLTAECGTLLTTVMDVKHSRGTTYVVLDAGVNALGGMWGLGRLLAPAAAPAVAELSQPPKQTANLVGPLCTPLDILGRSIPMVPPAIGEVLAIPNVGAYGLSASLIGFLSRSLPVEVVLDTDDAFVDARRLEIHTGGAL